MLPTGESAVLSLVPPKLQAGAVLHLLPDPTKYKKGGHCKITLSRDVMCFSTWFQMAVQLKASAGLAHHPLHHQAIGSGKQTVC